MMIDGIDHHTVAFDPASMLVCKRARASVAAEAPEQAKREYDYLQRFSAVLAPEPYLHCPRPVRVEPEQGRIWMTYCPGSQLHHVLAESNDDIKAHLDHLAEQVARAVVLYVREFDEPYHDLTTWNMLYQPSIRTLSLVDFAGRSRSRHAGDQASLEASLGYFIGSSTYHTVRARRASLLNLAYWNRQERLAVEVLRILTASYGLCPSPMRQVSSREYRYLAGRGGIRRHLWLATVGQVLFTRRRNTIIAKSLVGA
jgi:hypothetical protein